MAGSASVPLRVPEALSWPRLPAASRLRSCVASAKRRFSRSFTCPSRARLVPPRLTRRLVNSKVLPLCATVPEPPGVRPAQLAAQIAERGGQAPLGREAAPAGRVVETEAAGQVRPQRSRVDAGGVTADVPAARSAPHHLAVGAGVAAKQVDLGALEAEAVLAEGAVDIHRHRRKGGGAHIADDVYAVGQHALQREGPGGTAHRRIAPDQRPAELLPAARQVQPRAVLDDGDRAGRRWRATRTRRAGLPCAWPSARGRRSRRRTAPRRPPRAGRTGLPVRAR